jgi:hypothetical protein
MEQVAGDNHEIGLQLDGFIHDFGEDVVEVLASSFQTVLRVA